MKKFYFCLLGLFYLTGMVRHANAQSLVVSDTFFIAPDSIAFTYESPDFDSTDWIGIYLVEDSPEAVPSVVWNYIPSPSGILKLKTPGVTGNYKAFLLCCDGYDTIAISAEFRVVAPLLTSSASSYLKGDSIVFSYVSPGFTATDRIGIFPADTKPGDDNQPIDAQYIPDSAGTITFKTVLDGGSYDAYLLCCDGYDSLAAFTFNVIDPDVATVTPVASQFSAGSPIEISYNDPEYAEGDWIGIYYEGDDPTLVSSVVWDSVHAQTDTVSFPGTLAGGSYFAVLFCCGTTETEYARSEVFTVLAGAVGTYVKTSASVYPSSVNIVVNYRDNDWEDLDWVGIYPKGITPSGDPASTIWAYAESDSGTIEFNSTLEEGEWVVYLLCCDGYNIKAKYDFKVSDSEPSIIASSFVYAPTDTLVFHYNSPNYVDTDWIGIYDPDDVLQDTASITWLYLPSATGSLEFIYPDNHSLPPGEYWAALLCCDIWDLYAKTYFVISEQLPDALPGDKTPDRFMVFPNPTNGLITIRSTLDDKIQQIRVYSLTGTLIYQEKLTGSRTEVSVDLKSLDKGAYFLEIETGNLKATKKLIIQ